MSSAVPFGPTGEVVYSRTYSRTKPDGSKETWPDTICRVAKGNLALVYGDDDTEWSAKVLAEYGKLVSYMHNFALLPAGRHLWSTGVPGRQYLFNCHVAGWGNQLSEHFEFSFLRLMEGGGVGSNYSTKHIAKFGKPKRKLNVHVVCYPEHKDIEELAPTLSGTYDAPYGIQVEDSREGWAAALSQLIDYAMWDKANVPEVVSTLVFDVSKIRPSGAPLKTFGGTASGPAPFARMMHEVARVLNDAYDNGLTPMHLMEIDHAIAECVVSGGNRRSARMSMLHWNDPQIFDFINCKQDSGLHWTTNISVEIDDDFLKALEKGSAGPYSAWAVHEAVCRAVLENGEPGYWNSSLSQKGEVNPVICTNPCVTDDTWVMTLHGARQVKELIGTPFTAIVDGKPYATESQGFFKTGYKPVVKLRTSEGYTVKLTTDHKVRTPSGWIAAGKLEPGQAIGLSDNAPFAWGGHGTEGEGYLLGSLIGDGTFYPNGMAACAIWDNEGDEPVAAYIESEIRRLGARADFAGWHHTGDGTQRRIKTAGLTRLANVYGIVRGNKTVTTDVERADIRFYRGFLRGMFDTDGHVEGTATGPGVSIRLTQSNLPVLHAVQRMLARLGIRSAVRGAHPEGRKSFGGYSSKASYRLIITGKNAARYMEEVGFLNSAKADTWAARTAGMKRGFYDKPSTATVESVSPAGTEDVYDVTVEDIHAFDGNGIVLHNCGEITLTEWENCNLGHVNLDYFADKNWEELAEAHRLMARFLIRATFGDVNDPKQAAKLAKNRRIGVGHLGVQGYWAKQGIKYSDIPDTARWMLESLYQHVREEARRYAFELRIPEPVKVTTVAPTGSVAKLPGVSEGIHPIYSRYFERRVRFSKRDASQVNTVLEAMEAGFTVEDDVYDKSGMTAVVVYPTEDILVQQVRDLGLDPDKVVQSADELTPREMLEVQRTYQKYWADNAVSYTVNVPEDALKPADLEELLAEFLPELKGTTIMVDASRPQAPYTRITKEQYDAAIAKTSEDGTDLECQSGACPIK
jgi:ribonucleotide reductase alpha subunit